MAGPSYLKFCRKNYPWSARIDYRLHSEKYLVGKGEQGVLICEPYKSEILPYWKFKTAAAAKKSSQAILKLFRYYLSEGEFVGADMARKFLQMGYTRARRYANYKSGIKYDHKNNYKLLKKGTGDNEKQVAALIFYMAWQKAANHKKYRLLKKQWQTLHG
jgi:hypothetical protein